MYVPRLPGGLNLLQNHFSAPVWGTWLVWLSFGGSRGSSGHKWFSSCQEHSQSLRMMNSWGNLFAGLEVWQKLLSCPFLTLQLNPRVSCAMVSPVLLYIFERQNYQVSFFFCSHRGCTEGHVKCFCQKQEMDAERKSWGHENKSSEVWKCLFYGWLCNVQFGLDLPDIWVSK